MHINESTRKFIQEHKNENVRNLVLQHGKNSEIDIHIAAQQIAGYQRLKQKVPTFTANENILFPIGLSLEQCSSEITASYKANIVKQAEHLVDLTGGFGIDCFFLSQKFKKTDYIERNTELCEIAKHNYTILGRNDISVNHTDSTIFLETMKHADCIFIDPARRSSKGGKIAQLDECEPNMVELQDILFGKADEILLKLSPMIDITHTEKLIKNTQSIHVVSVNNECKEVLFLLKKNGNNEAKIHTINFSKNGIQEFSFDKTTEKKSEISYATQLGKYLYEPNVSILKAGAFKSIAAKFNLKKLDIHTHLYTSDKLENDFCGRIFRITNEYSLQKSCLKKLTSEIKQANISVRNFPKTVEQLRQN